MPLTSGGLTTGGLRTGRINEIRKADKAKKKKTQAQKTEARKQRAAEARARDAADRQRRRDKDKNLLDQKAADEAARKKKDDDKAQESNDPSLIQEPKKKGNFKGQVVSMVNRGTPEERAIWTAQVVEALATINAICDAEEVSFPSRSGLEAAALALGDAQVRLNGIVTVLHESATGRKGE